MNLRLPPILIALIVLTVSGSQLGAHEFWLEPDEFSPKLDARTGVRIRIGEHFDGALYPYLTGTFFKFTAGQGESEQAVEGLDGDDDPAIGVAFRRETLAIVAHHSQSNHVTLEPWTKFTEYLAEIGQEDIAKRHRALGKPTAKVEERYYRAAKLLLDVGGAGNGGDRFTGMPLELVADRNPYALEPGERFPVRLLRDGTPIAGVLVTAIAKSAPKMVQRVRTDKDGRVLIELNASGPWLINAVHMSEPPAFARVDWMSIWASLVFSTK